MGIVASLKASGNTFFIRGVFLSRWVPAGCLVRWCLSRKVAGACGSQPGETDA